MNENADLRRVYESAGYDIVAYKQHILPPMEQTCINTGIKISIPTGCYARIADRSSLAKRSIHVFGGVVDVGFTDEISLFLFNFSKREFIIEKGIGMAQLLLERIYTCDLMEVSEIDEGLFLRGKKKFGSSNVML